MCSDLQPLRASADIADRLGELTRDQIGLIHRSGWLKMLAPREFGGAERPLPEVVRLEEAIAHADGSCGWVVTLCAGAGWFAGFLPPDRARQILATPDVCLGGSGAPSGFAEREGTGWRLTGRWAHASGSQFATHFTLNALLRENGQPVLDELGAPRMCAFVVTRSAVRLEPESWHSIGLRASTSGAFSLDGVHVAGDHAFNIDARNATANAPLYRFPFRALAFVTLAACVSGMARNFVELADPLVTRRIPHLDTASPGFADTWRSGARQLADAREAFFATLDSAWALVARDGRIDDDRGREVETVSRSLVQAAREAVDAIYPCCGLRAADPRSEINRAWRDLHTATQHALWAR